MSTTPSDEPRRTPPGSACDPVTAAIREVAEVAAGFAVLGFQRLQVHRRDLERAHGIAPGTPMVDSLRVLLDAAVSR